MVHEISLNVGYFVDFTLNVLSQCDNSSETVRLAPGPDWQNEIQSVTIDSMGPKMLHVYG